MPDSVIRNSITGDACRLSDAAACLAAACLAAVWPTARHGLLSQFQLSGGG